MSKPAYYGQLYLLPSLLHPDANLEFFGHTLKVIKTLHHFFVENERTARRFLKALDRNLSIDDRHFQLVNNHEKPDLVLLKQWLKEGKNVGVISEAGYPCVADPGHLLVMTAHQLDVQVIPLIGPNSMIMALSASGFNGQSFRFTGYLPKNGKERTEALHLLEKRVKKYGETQLFMETPYRNEQLFSLILKKISPDLSLCIAVDLTAPSEFIKTKKISEWQKAEKPSLHKRPAIFVLGQYH